MIAPPESPFLNGVNPARLYVKPLPFASACVLRQTCSTSELERMMHISYLWEAFRVLLIELNPSRPNIAARSGEEGQGDTTSGERPFGRQRRHQKEALLHISAGWLAGAAGLDKRNGQARTRKPR